MRRYYTSRFVADLIEERVDRNHPWGYENAARSVKAELARKLRENATPQELIVWRWLKTRPFGTSWRFQAPVRGYIADFLCKQVMTVLEIDGCYHRRDADERRDGVLWRAGFQTLRFTNTEVEGDFPAVQHRILAAIRWELARQPA